MSLTLVSTSTKEGTFEDFWKQYPRKISRAYAEKIFARLTAQDKQKAISAIAQHIEHWREQATEPKFIPHASTWLSQRRFEDELECAMPETVFCKWPGCKSVGMKYYGKIACCDRHHDAYVRGLTP